jgi:hypothetical protein
VDIEYRIIDSSLWARRLALCLQVMGRFSIGFPLETCPRLLILRDNFQKVECDIPFVPG